MRRADRHAIGLASGAIVAVVAIAILRDIRSDQILPAGTDCITLAEKVSPPLALALRHDLRTLAGPLIAILAPAARVARPEAILADEPLLLRRALANRLRLRRAGLAVLGTGVSLATFSSGVTSAAPPSPGATVARGGPAAPATAARRRDLELPTPNQC